MPDAPPSVHVGVYDWAMRKGCRLVEFNHILRAGAHSQVREHILAEACGQYEGGRAVVTREHVVAHTANDPVGAFIGKEAVEISAA